VHSIAQEDGGKMQRTGWQRIWRGPKTPFIFVLGGGVVAGFAILALLFSSVRIMAAKTDQMAADRDRLELHADREGSAQDADDGHRDQQNAHLQRA